MTPATQSSEANFGENSEAGKPRQLLGAVLDEEQRRDDAQERERLRRPALQPGAVGPCDRSCSGARRVECGDVLGRKRQRGRRGPGSSSCRSLVALAIGAVTPGRAITQASATSAGVAP